MQAFRLSRPVKNTLPVVASIPHTGTYVPPEVDALFISDAVRQLPMTDWYLHELYDFLDTMGVTVLSANYSRYVIDLNRSPIPLELYPGRFETKLVAESDFQGQAIFSKYPDLEQIEKYKQDVHVPYHAALELELAEKIKIFGKVYLFDLHSIASNATLIHAKLEKDIYLGNRDGASCSEDWRAQVEKVYLANDMTVQNNKPYKGGYITHTYGQNENIEALQIEMNQEFYMNACDVDGDISSHTVLSSQTFKNAKQHLKAVFSSLLDTMDV